MKGLTRPWRGHCVQSLAVICLLPMDASSKISKTILTLTASACVLYACLPVLAYVASWDLLYLKDDMFQEYLSHGIFREGFLKYGRFTLWTPYIGGGYPLYAHPHDASFVIFSWLPVLVFGEVAGVKINILLLYLLGIAGAYLFIKKLIGKHSWIAGLAMVLYSVNPFFEYRLISGNYNELYTFLLPLICWLFICGFSDRRYWFAVSIAMAVFFFFGKFYFLLNFALFFAAILVWIGWRLWKKEDKLFFAFEYFFFCLTLTLLFSAVKLLPMLQLLASSAYKKSYVWESLADSKYLWPYLSVFAVAAICMLIAFAARFLKERAPYGIVRFGLVAKVAVLMTPVIITSCLNYSLFGTPFRSFCMGAFSEPFKPEKIVDFCQVKALIREDSLSLELLRFGGYLNFLRGMGTIDWYCDQIALPTVVQPKYELSTHTRDMAALGVSKLVTVQKENPKYRGEAFFSQGHGGILKYKPGPNRILIDLTVQSPGLVTINVNYDSAWKTNVGKIINANGLLGLVIVNPGTHRIVLTYRPYLFFLGLGISLTALIAGAVLTFGKVKKQ